MGDRDKAGDESSVCLRDRKHGDRVPPEVTPQEVGSLLQSFLLAYWQQESRPRGNQGSAKS